MSPPYDASLGGPAGKRITHNYKNEPRRYHPRREKEAGGRKKGSNPKPARLAAIEDVRRRIAGSALRTPLVRLILFCGKRLVGQYC
jgi:hypothetical protein